MNTKISDNGVVFLRTQRQLYSPAASVTARRSSEDHLVAFGVGFAVIFGYRRVVFATRVWRRIKYHWSCKASISRSRTRSYHSDEVGISLLLSLPICVIMGLHRRAGACSRRNLGNGGTKAPPYKGYGLCPKHL